MSMFELHLKTHLDRNDTSVDQWMLSHLCLGVHNPEVTVLYHGINKTEGVGSVYSSILGSVLKSEHSLPTALPLSLTLGLPLDCSLLDVWWNTF